MQNREYHPIDLNAKFSLFTDLWSPKVIGKMNDYLVKLGKVQGDFVWHQHAETDELFIVNKGELRIDFKDGSVTLLPGQMYIVPRGVEHRPHAEQECEIILFEPETTVNTGDVGGEMTIEKLDWI
jgi:mannose-6-phosphate isomerase-like protein (cupin superfamily)